MAGLVSCSEGWASLASKEMEGSSRAPKAEDARRPPGLLAAQGGGAHGSAAAIGSRGFTRTLLPAKFKEGSKHLAPEGLGGGC